MPGWMREASRRLRPLHLELEDPREEEPRRRPTNTTIRYTSGNQQTLRESVRSGRLRRWRCLRGASRSVELTGPKFSWDIMASTIVALVWISRTNGETCASRNRRQVLSKFALGMAKLGTQKTLYGARVSHLLFGRPWARVGMLELLSYFCIF